MSNSDSSQYVLRYNEVTKNLEYGSGSNWTPVALSGGSLAPSGVTPGSYTSTNLTVNAEGQITAAANGSGGGSTPNAQYVQAFYGNGNGPGDAITSTTWTPAVPSTSLGAVLTITPSSALAAIRISLSTTALPEGAAVGSYCLTVFRDGGNLVSGGPTPLNSSATVIGHANMTLVPQVSIDIIDVPGDTATHTYQVYAAVTTDTANGFSINVNNSFLFSAVEIH